MRAPVFWGCGMLLLCIVCSLVGQKLRRMEKEQLDHIYFGRRYAVGGQLYELYEFFSVFFLTRHSVHRIKRRMDIYLPGDEKSSAERTIRIFLTILLAALVPLAVVLFLRPRWVVALIFLSAVYFFSTAIMNYVTEKEEMQLLQHLLSFLSDIRHSYHETGMIEESITRAIHDKTPQEMRLHGSYLLDTLTAGNNQERIKDYLDHAPNACLKELFALCVTVLSFGDYKLEGQSLFLASIRNLKQSVNTEILRRKKQIHLFGGYAFILAAPMFTLPLISAWAVHTMPSLQKYYEGTYGTVFPLSAFFVTLVLYQCNLRLQQSYVYTRHEHSLFFYLSETERVGNFLQWLLAKNEGYRMRLKILLLESGDQVLVPEFLLKRIVLALCFFLSATLLFLCLPVSFSWYHIILCLGIAFAAAAYPVWMLHYERFLMKNARMDEVMQFQSLIYMLSPVPQMTPELILWWLDSFAGIFRTSITRAIDCLSTDQEGAFLRLCEQESYEPFQRLLENLQACDRIGVSAAFDELGAERIYFEEERRQQGEITLENKAAVGAFMVMIPTLFIVIGYLFLPFILESFSLFSVQLRQINF